MLTIEHLQLFIEGLILLLLLYVAFLKSYFQEKGKNLATKEDIEDITAKVESIKSHLQFSLHAGLSLRQEEHDALVDYYAKYIAWFAGITNCSFTEVTEDNAAELRDIRLNLERLEREYQLAEGRMELLVDNPKIAMQQHDIRIETLKFHGHALGATFRYSQLLLETRDMQARTSVSQQIEPYRNLLEKRRTYFEKFKEEQSEFYSRIYPLVSEHRSAVSEHIRKLVLGDHQ